MLYTKKSSLGCQVPVDKELDRPVSGWYPEDRSNLWLFSAAESSKT